MHKTSQRDFTSPTQTIEFATLIGGRLRGSEVIELVSDLGGGKTTFVKGLAFGAGSSDIVTSPSFTLRNDYLTSDFKIAHFDFYRLNDPGSLTEMVAEVVSDHQTVSVIEWARAIEYVLPSDRVVITLKVTSEDGRRAIINYPDSLAYLFEGA